MEKGFTIQLNADTGRGHTTQQQMVISYTMEGGRQRSDNAECRASLDTMEQEIRTEIKAQ